MINFKRVISVVVVFSLVLSSCGGNKNGGSGVSGLGRNVQLSIFENDIKTVGVAGDVVQVGSTIKLVGSRFEKCDLDSATGETVCVNKGGTSTVRFKRMKYGDKLFEGKDLQCALEGGVEGCGGAPLLVTCKSQEEGSEACVSPEIRLYGTRMAMSSEQKKAAEEKKATDEKERAGKYEKIKGATIGEAVTNAHSIVNQCELKFGKASGKNGSECAKAIGSYDNLNVAIHDIYLKGVTDKDFKDAEENLKVCEGRNTTFVDSWSGHDKLNRVCAVQVARVNDLNARKEEYEKAVADYMKEVIKQEPSLPKLLDSSDFDKGKAGDFSLLKRMKDGYWQRNGIVNGIFVQPFKWAWELGKGVVSLWESGVTDHMLPHLIWGQSLRGWAGVPILTISNILSSLISPAILPLVFGAYRLKHSPFFTSLYGLKHFYSKSELAAGWKSKTSETIMPYAPNLIAICVSSFWNAVRSLVFAGNGPEVSVGDVMKESASHNALELGSIGLAEIGFVQFDREFIRKNGIWSWTKGKWNAKEVDDEEEDYNMDSEESEEEKKPKAKEGNENSGGVTPECDVEEVKEGAFFLTGDYIGDGNSKLKGRDSRRDSSKKHNVSETGKNGTRTTGRNKRKKRGDNNNSLTSSFALPPSPSIPSVPSVTDHSATPSGLGLRPDGLPIVPSVPSSFTSALVGLPDGLSAMNNPFMRPSVMNNPSLIPPGPFSVIPSSSSSSSSSSSPSAPSLHGGGGGEGEEGGHGAGAGGGGKGRKVKKKGVKSSSSSSSSYDEGNEGSESSSDESSDEAQVVVNNNKAGTDTVTNRGGEGGEKEKEDNPDRPNTPVVTLTEKVGDVMAKAEEEALNDASYKRWHERNWKGSEVTNNPEEEVEAAKVALKREIPKAKEALIRELMNEEALLESTVWKKLPKLEENVLTCNEGKDYMWYSEATNYVERVMTPPLKAKPVDFEDMWYMVTNNEMNCTMNWIGNRVRKNVMERLLGADWESGMAVQNLANNSKEVLEMVRTVAVTGLINRKVNALFEENKKKVENMMMGLMATALEAMRHVAVGTEEDM